MEKLVYLKCYFDGDKIRFRTQEKVTGIKTLKGGYNITNSDRFNHFSYLKKGSINNIFSYNHSYNFFTCVWCKENDIDIYRLKLLNKLKRDKKKIIKSIKDREKEFIDYKEKAEKLLKILNKK